MRVAQGRLGVLDSVDKAQRNAGACVSTLTLLPRVVRYGTVAGAGLLGVGVVRQLLRANRSAPAAAPAAPVAGGSLTRYLVAQAATLVLLPWLRQRLLQAGTDMLARKASSSSNLLFRWLGLEK